ncbi:MAG: hypothetical protein E6399_18985 [Clostridium sp.]|uniref:hypothetical protein n=1 Tax=Bacillota TaxID=1239 RepID=UPI0021516603|nr:MULTISPECIES: hypothetical protein [Bacillota]MDU6876531.1 hypothetical protein [Clostridium sp.]
MFSLVSSISVIHIIWWTVNALSLVLIFLGSRKNIKYIDYKKKINGKEYLRDTGIAVLLIYFAIFISYRVNIDENNVSLIYYLVISIFALIGTLKLFLAGMNRISDIELFSVWIYPFYLFIGGSIANYYDNLSPIFLLGIVLLIVYPGKDK